MEYFKDSTEHLLAELERIDLLIAAQVAGARQVLAQDEQFRGLYISEEEVDTLLAQPKGCPRWIFDQERTARRTEQLAAGENNIEARKEESLRQGIELRLERLQRLFTLDRFDVDVLLICLAVEFDLRYERLYAYLQDDVTRKRPSIDLALHLLQPASPARFAYRNRFTANAPLFRFSLLEFVDDPSHPSPPLLARYLKVDNRIVRFLLDSDEPSSRLAQVTTVLNHDNRFSQSLNQEAVFLQIEQCIHNSEGEKGIFYLKGPYGAGKEDTALTVCTIHEIGLLAGDLEKIAAQPEKNLRESVALLYREAVLLGSAVLWKGFDILLDAKNSSLLDAFIDCLQYRPNMTFLVGEKTWQPAGKLRHLPFAEFTFPKPSFAERLRIWSGILEEQGEDGSTCDPASLAAKFKFTGGQILDAAATARNLMKQHRKGDAGLNMQEMYKACRLHSNQKLSALARKIKPNYSWEDIILPPAHLEQLQEICNFMQYRNRVYNDWGFSDKLSMGKGINALFAGPSGTGKTMAAEIIANELDLDMFKIDLSGVVSKYIGETEKNLAQIFTEAETSNAILFFDEADALFGKRSEVKDAHDRYANIETAYLLQRLEEYDGIVILATNLRKNMDEAFVRRLHSTIDFPFPEEQDRLRIWKSIWPAEIPMDPNLDLSHLARQFEVSGGNIRNIALVAAFLAADDSGIIDMPQLLRATRREYQKMGRVIAQDEFAVLSN